MPAAPAPTDPGSPRRRLRVRWVVAALVCVGVIVWMLVGGLAKNLVYLKPVSEAVEERADLGTRRFRMGGTVVPGSIVETDTGVRFELVEGGTTAEVDHSGDPPDLFEECAPVVVEGHWGAGAFLSDRLLIKHGEEYSPESESLDDCGEHPEGVDGSAAATSGPPR
ncbi:MAG: cytochrome c maturation protein CcmE [Acidimicrobiia bacterium]|nr:cytochrome c maturation protein CcmE [Acidimicrobiia bacterium]